MTDLSCPNCGAELDLMTLFSHESDQRALARLAAVSIPLGARVLQYVQLFTPARQRLTARKKIKLLLELLPELERGAVQHKGRDWAAPLPACAEAIDQMLAARDAGRLELPMKGHGYLFAILAGMADRHEAAAEKTREEQRRAQRAAHVKGAAVSVLDVVPGLLPLPLGEGGGEGRPLTTPAPSPSPQPSPARGRGGEQPKPGTSHTVRAMRAEIERAKAVRANPPQPQGADQ